MGLLAGRGYSYAALNLLGASLILISLVGAFNLFSAIIQISWILISIFGITRTYLLRRAVRFTDEEQRMLEQALPGMPPDMARRLLNRGRWHDVAPGLRLTEQGVPVDCLHYLSEGRVRVLVEDETLATLDTGFIGEMAVLEGGPASATVVVDTPSRVFSLPRRNLLELTSRDSLMQLVIEQLLGRATRIKLLEANRKLADKGRSAGADPLQREDAR